MPQVSTCSVNRSIFQRLFVAGLKNLTERGSKNPKGHHNLLFKVVRLPNSFLLLPPIRRRRRTYMYPSLSPPPSHSCSCLPARRRDGPIALCWLRQPKPVCAYNKNSIWSAFCCCFAVFFLLGLCFCDRFSPNFISIVSSLHWFMAFVWRTRWVFLPVSRRRGESNSRRRTRYKKVACGLNCLLRNARIQF